MSAELPLVEPRRSRRRLLITVLVLALTALSAGSIGWFAAKRYDAAELDGAGPAARQRCRAAVERELFRRSGQSAKVAFVDLYVIGRDQDGNIAASIEGTATTASAQGSSQTYDFGCSLSIYDRHAKVWGAMTMTM